MGPLTDRHVRERQIYRDAVMGNNDAAEPGDSCFDWCHRRHDAFRHNTLRVDGRGEPS